MNARTIIAIASLFGASLAFAQNQPAPPSQVCSGNGQCVTTPVTVTPVTAQTHAIKWNPGHYMDSESIMQAGTPISKISAELNDLNNQDQVLGFRVNISWGAIETSKGVYDFTTLDAILNQLKTAYNKPKRLVMYMWLYNNGSLGTNGDNSEFPLYIQQSSAYGASPVAGSYGWWGQNANGASTGMYAPAIWTQPVMDRLIALVQAIGAHYDNEPYFEAIDFQEDATIAQAASAFGANPTYTDAGWSTQLTRLLTAATAAFPHTSVVMDNSWFDKPPPAVAMQQWMAANRVAPGSADTMGQTAITAHGGAALSDGMKTLIGLDATYGGGTDLRPRTRAMLAVEGPDIMGPYFGSLGGPFTALDIINAANTTYFASHIFWTHLVGTETFRGAACPPGAKWSNLAAVLAVNPLIHSDYPLNYP